MSRVNEKDIEYPYYKCELTDEEAMHVGVNLHKLMVFIGENLEPKKEEPTQNAIYWIRKRLNHDYRRVSKRQLYNLMRMLTKDNRRIKYVKIPYISDKLFKAIFVMYEQALKSAKIPPENIKILSDMKKTRGRLFYCEQTNAFERSLPNYYYTTDKQLRLIQALHDDLSATGSTLGRCFMFSNYKNFERLRYQLINDYSFIQDSKKPEEQFIESALFSGLLSVIVSYLFSDELSSLLCDCRIRLFIKLPVLILVYSILYFSFKYIFVKIVESYNNRRIHKTKGPQNIKSVKKDFDNIAVDSLIMAMGYKDNTDNATTESSVNKKELYIYEMIHYINQAQRITKQLFQLKDNCINRGELSEGIDGYRVRNAVNIMDELMKSVEKYVSDLQLTDQVLIDNINRINQTLDDLKVSVKDI